MKTGSPDRSRFTESQIIKILSEQESVKAVSEICGTLGVSQPTYYILTNKSQGALVYSFTESKSKTSNASFPSPSSKNVAFSQLEPLFQGVLQSVDTQAGSQ